MDAGGKSGREIKLDDLLNIRLMVLLRCKLVA